MNVDTSRSHLCRGGGCLPWDGVKCRAELAVVTPDRVKHQQPPAQPQGREGQGTAARRRGESSRSNSEFHNAAFPEHLRKSFKQSTESKRQPLPNSKCMQKSPSALSELHRWCPRLAGQEPFGSQLGNLLICLATVLILLQILFL